MNEIKRVPVLSAPLLTAEDLSLWYDRTQALKSVSLDIPQGGVTALIGPSGCGKSTFLRCFNRMNDLVRGVRLSGRVTFDGRDVNEPGTDVSALRREVGMVFQKPNPFPMSVFDNVAYGPRTHGVRGRGVLEETVEKSLRDAALWDEVKDRLKKSALSLSGGQQQRLCIARALAVKPRVLLMDEPTSALDPIATDRVETLARGLGNRYTVVIVTHNLAQARRISDKTAFFLLGELVEAAQTDLFFSRPRDPRTANYLAGRLDMNDLLRGGRSRHPGTGGLRPEGGVLQCGGL